MYKVFTTLYGKKKLISEEKIIPRQSVYGVILDESKILLVNTKSTGKVWFPGGAMDSDVLKEDALKREVSEETGIEIEIIKEIGQVENFYYADNQQESWQVLATFYLCKPLSKNVTDKMNPEEHDEANKPAWYDVTSLREEDFQDYGFEVLRLLNMV